MKVAAKVQYVINPELTNEQVEAFTTVLAIVEKLRDTVCETTNTKYLVSKELGITLTLQEIQRAIEVIAFIGGCEEGFTFETEN